MTSYKETYEIEFIKRTKEILNNYNRKERGYKFTLLLNCLVSLIILPSERSSLDKPPLWNTRISQIPLFNSRVHPVWSDGKDHTLGEFVKKLRNGIAHQNVEPINKNGQFVGVKIWNVNPRNITDFEVEFNRHALHDFANFIADQYLHHVSAQRQQTIIEGIDG